MYQQTPGSISQHRHSQLSHNVLLSRLIPGSDDALFHQLHIELMLAGCYFSDKHEIRSLLLLSRTTATNQRPSKLFKPALTMHT